MKKRIVLILVTVLLVLGLGISAAADAPLVNDYAGLLTAQEVASLETQYASIRDSKGFTPYLVTVDSLEGRSVNSYSDDIFQQLGCDHDGMLLLVSMGERKWSIYVEGICDKTLTNEQIDRIGERVADHLGDGEYYDAFRTFGDESALQMSPLGFLSQEITFLRVVIALGVGLIVAFIVLGVMKSSMKTVKANDNANYYARPGSMHLTNSQDIFLYSNVTRVRKESSSSGGGGGGSSRGSGGGRSRGGSF